jgi:hypothetical protein
MQLELVALEEYHKVHALLAISVVRKALVDPTS